ncbi:MAG: hypothetical protein H6698_01165 [Myxococcales bacterium]|nr:hypothetical protein [Myxococcales bacterium]MCB9531001.1 hypothetical protein [Myxococcales bacterium]MCB9532921.1 hypothetical protein [Myxococcales bacterium]
MAKDKDRDEDEFSDDDMGDSEDEDAPVFDEDEEEATFDDDDPDDDDDEDSLIPARARVAATKRVAAKPAPSIGGVPRPKLDDPKIAAEVWKKLHDQHKDEPTRPYAITERFASDELLQHKTFGLGFVIAVPADSKIEVLFESGVRKLVQGR